MLPMKTKLVRTRKGLKWPVLLIKDKSQNESHKGLNKGGGGGGGGGD